MTDDMKVQYGPCGRLWCPRKPSDPLCEPCANNEIARLTDALERIACLDEADGHLLREKHAFDAVSIATRTLGKHPSEIDRKSKLQMGK